MLMLSCDFLTDNDLISLSACGETSIMKCKQKGVALSFILNRRNKKIDIKMQLQR